MTADGQDFWRLHWRHHHGQLAWADMERVAEDALHRWAALRHEAMHSRMRPGVPVFGRLDQALTEVQGGLRNGRSAPLAAALTRAQGLAKGLERCSALWTQLDALDQEWTLRRAELPLEEFEEFPCLSGFQALRDAVAQHLEHGRHGPGEACLTLLQGIVQRWQGSPQNDGGAALRRCGRLAWEGVSPERVENLKILLKSPLASLGEQLLDELQMQMPTVFAPPDRSAWRRRHQELLEQSTEMAEFVSGWLATRIENPTDGSDASEAEGKPDASSSEPSSESAADTSPDGFQLGRFH